MPKAPVPPLILPLLVKLPKKLLNTPPELLPILITISGVAPLAEVLSLPLLLEEAEDALVAAVPRLMMTAGPASLEELVCEELF